MQFRITSAKTTPVTQPAPGLTRLPAGLKVETRVKVGPDCPQNCGAPRVRS
jgi:hypothetical protein